tara:strand:+ start:1009 stop:1176 length:168 start_codon:yes stop_codon:yes gene_type:complete
MIIFTGGSSGLGKAITEDLRERVEEVLTLFRRKYPEDMTSYQSLKNGYFDREVMI